MVEENSNEFTKLGMNGFGIDLSNYADKFCENAEIKIVDITKEKFLIRTTL